ncbi:hypothetical protein Glove_139g399 [Diversispora epigaea]|uniref:Protein kinase domain-containing protein n=1 Tax=Diversispora epigaea TaxID=1348612 RepID=A0A397J006_9GLOM|nr:hypothetical protein Glove_139g399 [Diversispora epigaea]
MSSPTKKKSSDEICPYPECNQENTIWDWVIENQQWQRYFDVKDGEDEDEVGVEVALKNDNSLSLENINWLCFNSISWNCTRARNTLIYDDVPERKNIFGVLPNIAPEVLSGDEEYKKAADVYSYGIIAYELVTGFPPYPDMPHDKDLAMKICNGLRPKITFRIPKLIATIMREGKNKGLEIGIQIKKDEEFSANQELTNTTTTITTTPLNYQTHPQSIYTGRLLNFSTFQNPRIKKILKRNLKN